MNALIRRFRADKTNIQLEAANFWQYADFYPGAPSMAEHANFEIFRGTSIVLRFQLTVPEPGPNYVTGWTTQFTVRHEDADWIAPDANSAIVLQVAGALSTVPNALRYGIFDVALSANDTNLLTDKKIYDWSFRRTDTGNEDVLALGELRAWTTA